jgi:hypothetical protein
LVVALSLTLLGQLALHSALAFDARGFALVVIGALLMAVALLDQAPPGSSPAEAASPAPAAKLSSPARVSLLAVVACGSAGLLYALQATPPPPSYLWALPAWMLLIGLYCAATLPPPHLRLPRRLPRPGALAWAALAIFALGLLARGWRGGDLPATLSGDEGRFGLETMRVLAGEITNPFSTGWLSVPTLTFFYNAPSIALLGNTLLGLRLPWLLMGALNVLTVFWLATRLQGPAVGIVTATLLALYHYHIHYSRLGLNNIADPFFTALALLLLYRAYDRKSAVDWVLCGIVIGVGQYFYFGARFIAIVAVVSIACLALRDGRRFWREHRRGLSLGAGAALVAAAPIIQYAIRYPDIYNARVNQTGILQSGWLEAAMAVRGEGPALVLLDQLQRAALAFNAYPDRTQWYGLPGPLLDIGSGALFVLGLAFACSRLFNPRIFPMVAWWGGVIVLGGMLTESPPASQRLITAAVPAVFFIALALVMITRALVQMVARPAWSRAITWGVLGLAVVAFGASSLKTYFVDYTPQRIFGSYNGIISTEIGHYARRQLGPEWRIYFLGRPAMSFDFGANLYLAPDTQGIDIDEAQSDAERLRVAGPDKDAAFIVLPFREGELAQLQAIYPGGQLDRVPSPIRPEPLFFVYRVPRAQLSAATP